MTKTERWYRTQTEHLQNLVFNVHLVVFQLRATKSEWQVALKRLCFSRVKRNRWLHAICACTEWYSRSCISYGVAVHRNIEYAENS